MSSKRDRNAVIGGLDDILGRVIAGDREQAGRNSAGKEVKTNGTASGSTTIVSQVENTQAVEAIVDPSTAATQEQDIMTSVNVINDYDNMTNRQTDKQADNEADRQADKQTSKIVSMHTDKHTGKQAMLPKRSKLDEYRQQTETTDVLKPQNGQKSFTSELTLIRLREARRLAKSPTMTVTLRLPKQLNDWLDEYVHRAWPEKVRKQELVIEALELLFTRRGRSGDPLLDYIVVPKGVKDGDDL